MRLHLLFIVCLLGCGSVKKGPGQDDAAGGDGSTACVVHDTIDSCGAACAKCTPADDRQMPTCDGAKCDVACLNAAPKCTDNSCARLAWTFDSNMLDGITPRAPNGLVLAVRNHAGNLALAADVTDLLEISIMVPVCLSGNLQLQTKTLSATVYFDGGDTSGTAQYYLQSSVPAPMTGAYLTQQALPSRAYVTYSAPLSMSQFANTATSIVFQAGTLGAHFSGTIWFDDIKIQ